MLLNFRVVIKRDNKELEEQLDINVRQQFCYTGVTAHTLPPQNFPLKHDMVNHMII